MAIKKTVSTSPANTGVLGTSGGQTIVPALWAFKKYYSQTSSILGQKVTIDFKKAGMSNEFVNRIVIRLSGSINTGSSGAGTATGNDNPEGLLTNALLQTSPTFQNLLPVNGVSGRGMKWDRGVQRGRLVAYTAITDNTGATSVNWEYEFWFKRKGNFPYGVKKAIEYGLDVSKYTSVVLTLTFGTQATLFTTTNVWVDNMTLDMWADVSYQTYPSGEHATEIYEQSFPIVANGDLLINQLPAGCMYDEIVILGEHNNVLTDSIIGNIDIEGAGRVWQYAGDSNADTIRDIKSTEAFDGSVTIANLAGVYVSENSPSGSFLRAIDARQSQILIKVNIIGWTSSGTYNCRLIARKMVPYGVLARAPQHAGAPRPAGFQN